jgi:hypothetical protein
MSFLMSAMTLVLLRVTPDEWALAVDGTPDQTEAQRTRRKETFAEYTTALVAAERRVVPLAVAEMLLGVGMVFFAHRAARGRSWARSALIQLTVAHVGLSVVEWLATPDLHAPEERWEAAEGKMEPTEVTEGAAKLFQLGLGVGVSALSVIGLALPRSRSFYALTEQPSQR